MRANNFTITGSNLTKLKHCTCVINWQFWRWQFSTIFL